MNFNKKYLSYFQFTKKEQRGIIVLLLLICASLFVRIIISNNMQSPVGEPIKIEQMIIDKPSVTPKPPRAKTTKTSIVINTNKIVDPNSSSYSELMSAGFSKQAASNIIKYRSKGGDFKKYSDLQKIYGIDSSTLSMLEKNIRFSRNSAPLKKLATSKTHCLIEINTADTASLKTIPCIGSILSNRILKYRNLLGGFYSLKQIAEVYGIDSNCYMNIINYVTIDTSNLQILNLNSCNEKVLIKHPYISKYQAKAIVSFREMMSPFEDKNQLLDNYILTRSDYERVEYYLGVD